MNEIEKQDTEHEHQNHKQHKTKQHNEMAEHKHEIKTTKTSTETNWNTLKEHNMDVDKHTRQTLNHQTINQTKTT